METACNPEIRSLINVVALLVATAALGACVGSVNGYADSGLPDGTSPDGGAFDAGGQDAAPDGSHDASADAALPDGGTPSLAGTYVLGPREFDVYATTGVREASVAFDPVAGLFVAAFGIVPAAFRGAAATVRWDGSGSPAVGTAVVLNDAPEVHNSGGHVIAGATNAGQSRLLVAFKDDRLGGGNGRLEILAQLLEARSDGSLGLVGNNFSVSQRPATDEQGACIAYDAASNLFFVAWADDREVATRPGSRSLYGRSVSPSGSLGPEMRLGGQDLWQDKCAAAGGGGRFLVAWSSCVDDGCVQLAYRARVVTGSSPLTSMLTVRTVTGALEVPGVAHNARRDEWLLGWQDSASRTIQGVRLAPDGTTRGVPHLLASHAYGAGSPCLAYSRTTNSYLLAMHAWDTADAWAREIDADGQPVGNPISVNAVAPRYGTYFVSTAASTTSSRFLVLMSHDWVRIRGTLFGSTASLE